MFAGLFDKQRHESMQFLDHQVRRLSESVETQGRTFNDLSGRLDGFKTEIVSRLTVIEKHLQDLMVVSHPTPPKKEGEV